MKKRNNLSKEEKKKDLFVDAQARYIIDCIPGLIEAYALLAPLWTYLIFSFLVFLAGPTVYKDAPGIDRSIIYFSLYASVLIPFGAYFYYRKLRFARSCYLERRNLIEAV